jgi:hypothetical protein
MSPRVVVLGKKSWKCGGCIRVRVESENATRAVARRVFFQDNIPVTFMYSMKSVKFNCKSKRH